MRGSTFRVRSTTSLVGMALLFAACGASSAGSGAAGNGTGASSPTTANDAPSTEVATTEDINDVPSTEVATTEDTNDGSVSDWCTFVDEADAVEAVFDSFGANPAGLEAGMETVRDISQRLPNAAPDEIKADATVLSEGTLRLVAAIETADYNMLDADLSFMTDDGLEDRLDEATDNLDEYTQRECGRDFGSGDDDEDDEGDVTTAGDDPDDADDSDFDPSDGTIREQMVAQFEEFGFSSAEATCISENLDFSDPAVQSGDAAAMISVFDTCGISVDRLADLGSDSPGESATPGESWCDVVADSNSLDDEFDERIEGDSDGMKVLLDKVKALSPRFLAAAPDEIELQVAQYAATNDALVQIFADADFDETRVDQAAFAAAIEGLDGAETDIDVYTLGACGVALGPDDS